MFVCKGLIVNGMVVNFQKFYGFHLHNTFLFINEVLRTYMHGV